MGGQLFDAKRMGGFYLDPSKIIIIGHDTKDGSEHPLHVDDVNEPLDPAFVAELEAAGGPHTPIRVIKDDAGEAIAVIGRKRVRAMRAINKGKDPAAIRLVMAVPVPENTSPLDLMRMVASENVQRAGVTPMMRAALLQRLLDAGDTEKDAAITLGVSQQSIKNYQALLKVSAPVRKAIEENKLPATAASKLATLPAKEQKEALDELLHKDRKGSAVQAAARATRKRKPKTGKAGKKKAASEELHKPPSKRLQKKLLEVENISEVIGEDARLYGRYVLGQIGAGKFKGLQALINELGGSRDAE